MGSTDRRLDSVDQWKICTKTGALGDPIPFVCFLFDRSLAVRRKIFADLAVELTEAGINRSEAGLSRPVEDLCVAECAPAECTLHVGIYKVCGFGCMRQRACLQIGFDKLE